MYVSIKNVYGNLKPFSFSGMCESLIQNTFFLNCYYMEQQIIIPDIIFSYVFEH